MRVRIAEAIAQYNEGKDRAQRMTKLKLATLIEYDRMNDTTMQQYLSHYDKGKFNCPLVVLVQIKNILGVSYETLLEC